MRKYHFQLEAYAMNALTAVLLLSGLWIWSSCKDDDGLEAGDPNYFTSSRGQFTATQDDGTTLFLLPGSTSGSATLTYDGSNPRHWQSETNANVNVTTYQGDLTLSETLTANGQRYTLTAIGSEALMGCRSLTSVVLPATIKSLGEGAFAICTTLTAVNIPEGVTDIPTGCFGYCPKLTTMVLPSTVKTLGAMAFFGCSGLTAMTLPEGLTSIGERCFFDCSKLTEITIPSTVKTIGSRCFGGRSATDRSKIAVYHMLSSTPPTLEGVLYEAQEGVTPVIKVPAGAVAAYQAAAGWSTLTIEEEDAQ